MNMINTDSDASLQRFRIAQDKGNPSSYDLAIAEIVSAHFKPDQLPLVQTLRHRTKALRIGHGTKIEWKTFTADCHTALKNR